MTERVEQLPPFLQLTLDDEIRRLIGMHGRAAVKASIRHLTGARRGRPEITADTALFADLIKTDAVDWLAGRDPFKIRTNTFIAREFAKKEPGHSAESTVRRIHRKLSKERKNAVMIAAVLLSSCTPPELALAGFAASGFPFSARLSALKALAARGNAYWGDMLEADLAILGQYSALHGEPPSEMGWHQIFGRARQSRSVNADDLVRPTAKETLG